MFYPSSSIFAFRFHHFVRLIFLNGILHTGHSKKMVFSLRWMWQSDPILPIEFQLRTVASCSQKDVDRVGCGCFHVRRSGHSIRGPNSLYCSDAGNKLNCNALQLSCSAAATRLSGHHHLHLEKFQRICQDSFWQHAMRLGQQLLQHIDPTVVWSSDGIETFLKLRGFFNHH